MGKHSTVRNELERDSVLSEVTCGPVSRSTLALFAGASNDHVPLHIDSDFAKASGFDDVFVHGMLTMAYLAQAICTWVSQDKLRGWNIRFTGIVPVNATVTCRGTVAERYVDDGESRARLAISAWTDNGVKAIDGMAIVAVGE